MAARRRIVAGNWKMNLDHAAAVALTKDVAAGARSCTGVDLVLCPPAIYLEAVASALQLADGSSPSGVTLGGQNLHDQPKGAFTGEIAPAMLVDVGCRWCIVGHSERRTLFGETDQIINTKAKAALTAQIDGSLHGFSAADLAGTVIAYEPVWAIGTGKVATPEQAQEVHALIRSRLATLTDAATADSVVIQYGGSVKPDNAAVLASQPDIDGALVGGASLKADDFLAIGKHFGAAG
jgi:triosephosphate isomerase